MNKRFLLFTIRRWMNTTAVTEVTDCEVGAQPIHDLTSLRRGSEEENLA